jgi:hypothetical protein
MLLNDFYQLLHNIASNVRNIMSDKFGSGHGLYLEIIQNLSGESEVNHKIFSQNLWCLSWNLNQSHPK